MKLDMPVDMFWEHQHLDDNYPEYCPRCIADRLVNDAQLSLLQQIVDDMKEQLATLNTKKNCDHISPFRVLFLDELINEYEAIIEGVK